MISIIRRLDKKFQMLSADQPCIYGHPSANCRHHLVRRIYKTTRWDWRNGINVCIKCHNEIHAGKKQEPVSRELWDLLNDLKNQDWHKYLLDRGMTEMEFYQEKERELDEQLKNQVRYICRSANDFAVALPF